MLAYPIWAYYAHGRQRRCQEDPVSLPSGRLEKTTRSSPHHVAQHHPTGSETTPPYAPRSSRFGSELPSVKDDVDVWRYAILSCMPETTTIVKDVPQSAREGDSPLPIPLSNSRSWRLDFTGPQTELTRHWVNVHNLFQTIYNMKHTTDDYCIRSMGLAYHIKHLLSPD